MTEDEICRLAYAGTPPDSALPCEWLLWYRMRDVYRQVRTGDLTEEKGRKAKTAAVNSYLTDKEMWERYPKFWKKIEYAATQYAKSEGRTPEGDAFYEAVYGLRPSNHHEEDKE